VILRKEKRERDEWILAVSAGVEVIQVKAQGKFLNFELVRLLSLSL